MENEKKIRNWQLLTLLLVICNLGVLATLWFKPGHHPPPPPPPGQESPRDFLLQCLKPGDDQARELDQLINEHRQKMEELNVKGRQLKQAYFMTLTQADIKQNTKDSLVHEIVLVQQQIETSTYDHLGKVKAMCSDPQKATFDKMLPEMLNRMKRPGGGPHQSPEGPPPPPER